MKNCIIYSVKNDNNHLQQLNKSLSLVRDNLNHSNPDLDILFFCDPGADVIVKNIVQQLKIPNKIRLLGFNMVQPKYSDDIEKQIKENCTGTPYAYKHMCRFWAGEIFKRKEVLEYDYYLRLDCDSYITSPITYNLFEYMESKGKICAYISGNERMDAPHVSQKLPEALIDFELQHKELIIKSVEHPVGLWYRDTNFEIVKISVFSTNPYMLLYDYINETGGIYMYRWGDHIIRYAGVHMLYGEDKVEMLEGIKYTHSFFTNGVFSDLSEDEIRHKELRKTII